MAELNVHIEPWTAADRDLLTALLGVPEMTAYLGGPETVEKMDERQARWAQPGSRQYRIVVDDIAEGVGHVGYWEKHWRGDQVWEVGWGVVRAYQGRGLATRAMQLLLDVIRQDGPGRVVHAFPSVDNAPSNAVCRKLGFTLAGAFAFEYPPGNPIRCNDWYSTWRTWPSTPSRRGQWSRHSQPSGAGRLRHRGRLGSAFNSAIAADACKTTPDVRCNRIRDPSLPAHAQPRIVSSVRAALNTASAIRRTGFLRYCCCAARQLRGVTAIRATQT